MGVIEILPMVKNNQRFDATMCLLRNLENDLLWWSSNILIAKINFKNDCFAIETFSYASLGWGACSVGKKAHGFPV